jgi:hypothetical protein
MGGGLVSESTEDLLGRANNLFEFLAKTQQLRETPQRTTASYDMVTWFDDLPEHTQSRRLTGKRHPSLRPRSSAWTVCRAVGARYRRSRSRGWSATSMTQVWVPRLCNHQRRVRLALRRAHD